MIKYSRMIKALEKIYVSLTLSRSKVKDDAFAIVNAGIVRGSNTQFVWRCGLDCFKST